MKANELMIEDWVQIAEPCKYADAIGRVKTLIDHKDDENAYFKVFLQNNTIHIGIEDICSEDIRPIPLTPEILEKNDWEERPTGYVFYTDGKRYDNSLWYIFDSNTFVVNTAEFQIKYVHELQHAMRLCGIEKEIIL